MRTECLLRRLQHAQAHALSAGKGTDREWLVCCLTTYSFPFAFGCALLLVLSAYIRTVELTPLAGTP